MPLQDIQHAPLSSGPALSCAAAPNPQDIVGFQQLNEQLHPRNVMSFLDSIYTAIDAVIDCHVGASHVPQSGQLLACKCTQPVHAGCVQSRDHRGG